MSSLSVVLGDVVRTDKEDLTNLQNYQNLTTNLLLDKWKRNIGFPCLY